MDLLTNGNHIKSWAWLDKINSFSFLVNRKASNHEGRAFSNCDKLFRSSKFVENIFHLFLTLKSVKLQFIQLFSYSMWLLFLFVSRLSLQSFLLSLLYQLDFCMEEKEDILIQVICLNYISQFETIVKIVMNIQLQHQQ